MNGATPFEAVGPHARGAAVALWGVALVAAARAAWAVQLLVTRAERADLLPTVWVAADVSLCLALLLGGAGLWHLGTTWSAVRDDGGWDRLRRALLWLAGAVVAGFCAIPLIWAFALGWMLRTAVT